MQNINVDSSGALDKVSTVGRPQNQWRPWKGMEEMYKCFYSSMVAYAIALQLAEKKDFLSMPSMLFV